MANNDELELPAAAVAPKRKKGRMFLIIGVVALLMLGGGGYALFAHKGKTGDAHAAQAKPEESKQELYLPLDPAFVVNFQGEQTARYLQVGVTLMAHDQKALDAAKDAQPVVRNALVLLFSNQSFTGLSDAAGKEKLQAQALAAVQKIVKQRTGTPGVQALYFTSFVMQ